MEPQKSGNSTGPGTEVVERQQIAKVVGFGIFLYHYCFLIFAHFNCSIGNNNDNNQKVKLVLSIGQTWNGRQILVRKMEDLEYGMEEGLPSFHLNSIFATAYKLCETKFLESFNGISSLKLKQYCCRQNCLMKILIKTNSHPIKTARLFSTSTTHAAEDLHL